MLKEFFKDDVESKFIKSIISATPFPIYNTVRYGDYIIKDALYIYRTYLIKCLSSGYLLEEIEDYDEELVVGQTLGTTASFDFNLTSTDTKYQIVVNVLNDKYPNEIEDHTYKISDRSSTLDDKTLLFGIYDFFIDEIAWGYSVFDTTMSDHFFIYVKDGNVYGWRKIQYDSLNKVIVNYETGIINDLYASYGIGYKGTPQVGDIITVHYTPARSGDEIKLPATYKILDNYIFGENKLNLTRKYIVSDNFYSRDVHKYLGEYLRCFRDIYDINLMSMYNCFTYDLIDGLSLNDSTSKPYSLETKQNYKVISVPIKFNRKYTLVFDNTNYTLIYPMLLTNSGLLNVGDDYIVDVDDYRSFRDYFKLQKISSISFKNPYLFEINCDNIELYRLEKYLRLIIQLPSTNTSSIVILEGDFSSECINIINGEFLDNISKQDVIDEALSSKKKLTMLNDNTQYAYNDIIIQYLLQNVITNREYIPENIHEQQIKIDTFSPLYFDSDLWSNQIRYAAYMSYMNSDYKHDKYDINGFIDNKMEKYINEMYNKRKK